MFEKLIEKISLFFAGMNRFLRNYIHPFLAPLFTIFNYYGFIKVIKSGSG
jgi:hypothetical protein